MNTTTAVLAPEAPIARKSSEWIKPEALRALLKTSLGYNARQVTVSQGHSLQYLTITVRDAAVDFAKVKGFGATLDTWSMDQSDYVTGQSVRVETTEEVDDAHAAPFLAEIAEKVKTIGESNLAILSNEARLTLDHRGFYVYRGDARRPYVDEIEVRNGTPWAIRSLALSAARV